MLLWQLIRVGGFTMYILLSCSVLSLAIILERYTYYRRRSKMPRIDFMLLIREALERGNVKKAQEICKNTNTPFSSVVYSGLSLYGNNEVVKSRVQTMVFGFPFKSLSRN
jgi:biopolymer transport protein ExbB